MKTNIIRTTLFSVFYFIALLASAKQIGTKSIVISNDMSVDREEEVVEVSLNSLGILSSDLLSGTFRVLGNDKEEIQYQLSKGKEGEDVLLLLVELKANESKEIRIENKKTKLNTAKTFCRFVPERFDDFAWENDRVAFRTYGDALAKNGELSSGIDVWVKSTDKLIIDKWYKAHNYHKDNGEGCDYFKVGPSMGAGASAPYVNNSLYISKNFVKYEVIETGPIRLSFKLYYDHYLAGLNIVKETRCITMDAGSNLYTYDVTFDYKGKSVLPIASGLITRTGSGVAYENSDLGILAYKEPTDTTNGTTFTACVFDNKSTSFTKVQNHIVGITESKHFSYLTGAAWSKSNEFNSFEDWIAYLNKVSQEKQNPIQIELK